MKIAIVRKPSAEFGLHGHLCCTWLESRFPGVEFSWHAPHEKLVECDGYVLMGDESRTLHSDIQLKDLGYVTGIKQRTVATFDIEDAWHFMQAEDETNDKEEPEDAGGSTVRPANQLFWVQADICKLLHPLRVVPSPKIHTMPNLDRVMGYLDASNNQLLTIDIETRREDRTLSCIGFKLPDTPAIVVPIYDYRGELAYDKTRLLQFFRSLILAMHRNVLVLHNAMFDLLVLASKYRCSFGHRIFDTMLMTHRVFPEIEKSLGHSIRLWLNHPWHKDENIETPKNRQQQAQHWNYNGLDVLRTEELYYALQEVGQCYPLLGSSMCSSCASIYPYALATLRGMAIDLPELTKQRMEADRRTQALTRVCRILSGDKEFNPASSVQCAKYFYDELYYKVSRWTPERKPSADSKALYELATKYPNPLLRAIIAARISAKEVSNLNFTGWRLPTWH